MLGERFFFPLDVEAMGARRGSCLIKLRIASLQILGHHLCDMKSFLYAIGVFALFLTGSVQAQIYADFTVSHGGSPLGTFRVRLDYDKAPRTCANFIGLATGQKVWLDTTTGKVVEPGTPYYDGLTFHRLIHTFMIQGGDPKGTGRGGPGYSFQDEFHPTLRHKDKYVLSMANSGTNTNGSQFFIMLVNNWTGVGITHEDMDNKHSVFGAVISGRAIIDGFTNATNFPTGASGVPDSPIVMESVVISGPSLSGFDINDPAWLLPTVNGVETKVAHDPDADTYTVTWDRKAQAEYLPAFSFDLASWGFTDDRFLLSLQDQEDQDYTIVSATWKRFFSRVAEVDYTLTPRAPSDLTSVGKSMVVAVKGSETITMNFTGSGAGTWTSSSGGSGSLSGVEWVDSLSKISRLSFPVPQARHIPLGNLKVIFDTPAGSERWDSFDFDISFHTITSGWCSGQARATINPPVPDSDPIIYDKRTPFTYTP